MISLWLCHGLGERGRYVQAHTAKDAANKFAISRLINFADGANTWKITGSVLVEDATTPKERGSRSLHHVNLKVKVTT